MFLSVITSVEIIIYVLDPQPHVQLSATAIALIVVSLILITFVVPITFIIGYLFGKTEDKVSRSGLHEVSASIIFGVSLSEAPH